MAETVSNDGYTYQSGTHKPFNGVDRVVLYQLATTDNNAWYVRIRLLKGGYLIRSLKTSSLDGAKNKALIIYSEVLGREKKGLTVGTNTFKALWKRFINDSDFKKARYKRFKLVYKNYLSWFNNYDIAEIRQETITNWVNFRLDAGYERNKRPVSATTISGEVVMLKQVLRYGVAKSLLQVLPTFNAELNKIKSDKITFKKRRGGAIEDRTATKIMDILYENMVKPTNVHRYKWSRQLLYYYIVVCNEAGLRPGTEATTLRWRDLYTEQTSKGMFQYFKVAGKREAADARRDKRVAILAFTGMEPLWKWKELCDKQGFYGPDEYIFRDHIGQQVDQRNLNRSFRKLLKKAGLYAVNGKAITLYSWRSNRINKLLNNPELTLAEVARLSGTSLRTIQSEYYDQRQLLSGGTGYARAAGTASIVPKDGQ